MRCSLIVTTFNRPADLERCIASLMDQEKNGCWYEIIIVDDASDIDLTQKYTALSTEELPVLFVRHTQNSGLSASRNTGSSKASGDLFFFIDDDIVLDPGYLAAHIILHKKENVATVGNLHFPAEAIARNNIMQYIDSRYLGSRKNLTPAYLNNLSPENFGAGISAIKKSHFLKIGGFSTEFRHYGCEDVFCGQLLKEAGVDLVFAGEARATHYDTVFLNRYRTKAYETANKGWPILFDRFPGLLKSSSIRWLMPRNSADSLREKIIKSFLFILLNKYSSFLFEKISMLTNNVPWLYSFLLHRLLFASWYYNGLRQKK